MCFFRKTNARDHHLSGLASLDLLVDVLNVLRALDGFLLDFLPVLLGHSIRRQYEPGSPISCGGQISDWNGTDSAESSKTQDNPVRCVDADSNDQKSASASHRSTQRSHNYFAQQSTSPGVLTVVPGWQLPLENSYCNEAHPLSMAMVQAAPYEQASHIK